MRALWDIPTSAGAMAAALEGLARLNEWVLARRPFPPLYDSGVRYRPERKRRRRDPERWLRIDELYQRRYGDCEDIVAARVAELRHAGVFAEPYVIRTGPKRFHALVALADGSTEDPSRELGM